MGGRVDRINDTASYVAPLFFLRLRGLEELKAEFVTMFTLEALSGSHGFP